MKPLTFGNRSDVLSIERSLDDALRAASTASERLSSGLRINRASDDAASLAIADDLNASARVYAQGIRNLSDGLSAVTIADSAFSSLGSIVTRLSELAEQAANGTYGDAQRQAIDAEAQKLVSEYTRIVRTTSFDGQNLVDGSTASIDLQLGFGDDERIAVRFAAAPLLNTSTTVTSATGLGTFTSAGTVPGGYGEDSVLADVNGDGKLDAIGGRNGDLSVALGNGDGTFQAATLLSGPGADTVGIAAVDLNGDSQLDLIATDSTGGVDVFLNQGGGTFGAPTTFGSSGGAPTGLAAADLNHDGKIDVVYTNGANVYVRLGNGDGTFGAESSTAAGAGARSPLLVDLNNDGSLDIVTANLSAGTVSFLRGNGDGTFQAPATSSANANPNDIKAADLNGDGKLDLVVANVSATPNEISLLLGTGTGTFQAPTTLTPTSRNSDFVAVADFNSDGVPDIVDAPLSDLDVFLSHAGGYNSPITLGTGVGVDPVATGDLNGDGIADILWGAAGTGQGVFLTNSSSSTTVTQSVSIDLSTASNARLSLDALKVLASSIELSRNTIGAGVGRIEAAIGATSVKRETFTMARGRMMDADMAETSADYVAALIRSEAAVSALKLTESSARFLVGLIAR